MNVQSLPSVTYEWIFENHLLRKTIVLTQSSVPRGMAFSRTPSK